MHDNRTHPLLEQIPLTVSPFVNLPTATTLPYTYKTLPSTLPPSATGIQASSSTTASGDPSSTDDAPSDPAASTGPKPAYVISASGHAAHPDDIIASCRALQSHLAQMQADAERELRELDERIRARDLAEKRRVAPGWLDSENHLLEPERTGGSVDVARLGDDVGKGKGRAAEGSVKEGLAGLRFGDEGGRGARAASEMAAPDPGEELDRAFGVMGLSK